jgi:hypothetical protein
VASRTVVDYLVAAFDGFQILHLCADVIEEAN